MWIVRDVETNCSCIKSGLELLETNFIGSGSLMLLTLAA